ncbi:MAG: putative Ig domain-containing protein [Nitrospiraceae bacterium]
MPYLFGAAGILFLAAGGWMWSSLQPQMGAQPASTTLPEVSPSTSSTLSAATTARILPAESGGFAIDVDTTNTTDSRFTWFRNNALINGQTGRLLPIGIANAGDRLHAEILSTMQDGSQRTVVSSVYMVEASSALIRGFRFEPSVPRSGEALTLITEASDVDPQSLTLRYRWIKNDNVVQESASAVLAADQLARGDRVQVEVTASLSGSGDVVHKSDTVTIGNAHPRITSTPMFSLSGSVHEYRVVAVDPEHDPVHFQLSGAPVGMAIDASSGRLQWTPSGAPGSTHRVRVEAHDDSDGVAVQEFDVTVPEPPKAAS